MDNVTILRADTRGKNFIPAEYLPKGKNEYYLRDQQSGLPTNRWRRLLPDEIDSLIKNGNRAASWDEVLVADQFDPDLIRGSEFFGLVRIGTLRKVLLQHHDLQIPAGITDSCIIACDIGDDVAIHHVRYCAHYIIGNRSILANIHEMLATNRSKFGSGILKDGEPETGRVWIEIMNEGGGRKVLPFDGMISADAYLWAKYRDDEALQKKLVEITQAAADSRRGFYGTVGEQSVIKNSGAIKDVKIGSHCHISGANKIENVTIHSSAQEPTSIGEGVELVNGIVGHGCRVLYGSKAVGFILGDNATLKFGARLIDSFLGDNSTISCCEVLHNLIFPAHEQHHNNSFLIASLVMGQSNIAAGATIGSNHNSRTNDNEVQAGRGFWPSLCTSVKHTSRFASFTLLAKGDYPAEMDIPLPFSLLNNNVSKNRLEIMPAYWWRYNMYALARNPVKFRDRDKRKTKVQNIEFDFLAPDTVEEIMRARTLIELWTGKAALRKEHTGSTDRSFAGLARKGRTLLAKGKALAAAFEILGEDMEKSDRKTVIIKAAEGYRAYGDMLYYYAVKNIAAYCLDHPTQKFTAVRKALSGTRTAEWTNLGGQIVPTAQVDRLRSEIGSGKVHSWESIRARYNELWKAYPLEKQRHAFAVLCGLLGTDSPTVKQWHSALDSAAAIQTEIRDRVYISLKKDGDNPFRKATFRNDAEMIATVGTADENDFVVRVRDETIEFLKTIAILKKRT